MLSDVENPERDHSVTHFWHVPCVLTLDRTSRTLPGRGEVRHLLLIGAYRDNEVDAAHPLMRRLEAIRRTDAAVRDIVLGPLSYRDLGQLIGDALHCAREHARPLVQIVDQKTGGNPFFAIQFLTMLTEEGMLRSDRDGAGWIWDLGRIHAKGYSGNVVELMIGKLQRFSGTTQTALQQLTCLGNLAGSRH
jgi:predicted ATPase